MKNIITWVGIDDSENKLNVAIYNGDEEKPREEWPFVNDPAGLGRLAKKLKSLPGTVRCVYEAGVNGYHLQRFLSSNGISCDVAAPSLTPRRSGKRVKTDKIDAKDLARLYRAGELTAIGIPSEAQESLRDLLRAREDGLEDLQRTRHRLMRFLVRRGRKYRTGKSWSHGHLQWLNNLRFEDAHSQVVLEEYRCALHEELDRLKRYDERVREIAKQEPYRQLVSYLVALKGIKELTALTIIAETIDLKRFTHGRALMKAIGVIPSLYGSGEREHRGSITRTGNYHLRRVLIESAWNYRYSPRPSKTIRARRAKLPPEVLAIAEKADKRLHKKFWHLVNKGKDRRKAVVAVARELTGFIWAIGQAA